MTNLPNSITLINEPLKGTLDGNMPDLHHLYLWWYTLGIGGMLNKKQHSLYWSTSSKIIALQPFRGITGEDLRSSKCKISQQKKMLVKFATNMKAETWGKKKTMLHVLYLVIKAWINPWKLPYYLSNLDTIYIISEMLEIPNFIFFWNGNLEVN